MMATKAKALTPAQRFFYEHQALCINPGETRDQARIRCARENASAEAQARDRGWYIETEPDGTRSAWQDDGAAFDIVTPASHVDKEASTYTNYDVTLYDADGTPLAALRGVTFANNNPHEPYRRVVAAELACEALARTGNALPDGGAQ